MSDTPASPQEALEFQGPSELEKALSQLARDTHQATSLFLQLKISSPEERLAAKHLVSAANWLIEALKDSAGLE